VELLPLGPGIRQHVVQGVDDTIVKASVAESFVRKARAAGETAIKLDLIDDAGHFEIMSPMSKIWSDKVVPLYLSFVA
jgi:alpha-beta hydrolase superfamily lysophospholipase